MIELCCPIVLKAHLLCVNCSDLLSKGSNPLPIRFHRDEMRVCGQVYKLK